MFELGAFFHLKIYINYSATHVGMSVVEPFTGVNDFLNVFNNYEKILEE